MKIKLISLAALAFISFNANADVISNAPVTFMPAGAEHLVGDNASTHTDDAIATVGHTVNIKTHHAFNVANSTNEYKNYVVLEKCEVDGTNYKKSWGFSLAPHQSKNFAEDAYLAYKPDRGGKWTIESITCVANSGACSKGRATLIVR